MNIVRENKRVWLVTYADASDLLCSRTIQDLRRAGYCVCLIVGVDRALKRTYRRIFSPPHVVITDIEGGKNVQEFFDFLMSQKIRLETSKFLPTAVDFFLRHQKKSC